MTDLLLHMQQKVAQGYSQLPPAGVPEYLHPPPPIRLGTAPITALHRPVFSRRTFNPEDDPATGVCAHGELLLHMQQKFAQAIRV
jgi:hypothetical protein